MDCWATTRGGDQRNQACVCSPQGQTAPQVLPTRIALSNLACSVGCKLHKKGNGRYTGHTCMSITSEGSIIQEKGAAVQCSTQALKPHSGMAQHKNAGPRASCDQLKATWVQ